MDWDATWVAGTGAGRRARVVRFPTPASDPDEGKIAFTADVAARLVQSVTLGEEPTHEEHPGEERDTRIA